MYKKSVLSTKRALKLKVHVFININNHYAEFYKKTSLQKDLNKICFSIGMTFFDERTFP